jgi:hypothetical protein
VYVGDTITAEAEVLTVHDTKPVCQLGIVVRRLDGKTVLEGEAWCYRFTPAEETTTEAAGSDDVGEPDAVGPEVAAAREEAATADEDAPRAVPGAGSEEPEKSWPRIRLTIAGFYKKHGRWPAHVYVPPEYLVDLEQQLRSEDFDAVRAQVELRAKADVLRAEDAAGGDYEYGESLASRLTFPLPDPLPDWLTLRPVNT